MSIAACCARPLLLALAALLAWPVQAGEPPGGHGAAVDELLRPFTTRVAISRFTRRPKPRCSAVEGGVTYCQWELTRRSDLWAALAERLGTEARLGLVCRFPRLDERAHRDWCGVWPSDADENPLGRAETTATAVRRALARARTLDALVGFLGAPPEYCLPRPRGLDCVWLARRSLYGHSALARLVGQDGLIRVTCRVPDASGERPPGGCAVEPLEELREEIGGAEEPA